MTVQEVLHMEKGSHIELPVVGWVEVVEVFPSYNRTVFLARPVDAGLESAIVVKSFLLTNAADPQQFITTIQGYFDSLRSYGVRVVHNIQFLQSHGDEGTVLIQTEKYVGPNLDQWMQKLLPDGVVEIQNIIKSVLTSCFLPLLKARLPENGNPERLTNRLEIGLDFLGRNIVCRKDPSQESGWLAVYVDLMPAKLILGCGAHGLEFPEPQDPQVRRLGIFRHYNLAGLLIAFWCHLTKHRPEWGQLFFKAINRFLKDRGLESVRSEIGEYMSGLGPRVKKLSSDRVDKLVSDWTFEDVFRFRILACQIASFKEPSESLERILSLLFSLTHFQERPLEEDAIARAKKLIVELVKL